MQSDPNAHSILQARPAPGLEAFVRCYGQRRGHLPLGAEVVQPVHARAAAILEFILGDRARVIYTGSGAEKTSPQSVLIGMQTFRRATLHISGQVDTFAILFQPTGLYRLFSLPMMEMTDRDYTADSVLGRDVGELEARLAESRTFEERVAAADRYLLRRLVLCKPRDSVTAAAANILRSPGSASTSALATMTGLSLRQFERRFQTQVGMSPKEFACIVRFEAVMDRMTRRSDALWTDAAHRFGYHDQMHMVHDIQRFTGESPTRILSVFRLFFRDAVDGFHCSSDPNHVLNGSRLIL